MGVCNTTEESSPEGIPVREIGSVMQRPIYIKPSLSLL